MRGCGAGLQLPSRVVVLEELTGWSQSGGVQVLSWATRVTLGAHHGDVLVPLGLSSQAAAPAGHASLDTRLY